MDTVDLHFCRAEMGKYGPLNEPIKLKDSDTVCLKKKFLQGSLTMLFSLELLIKSESVYLLRDNF